MSRVIKCQSVQTLGQWSEVRPADLAPIGAVAADPETTELEDPIARATQEAQIIVNTARAEADDIYRKAYEEGFASGVRDSAQAASELIARLESDLAALAAERTRLVDEIEPQVLKLCMEAVEKVIRHEIRTDPRVVVRVVKSCLRRVSDFGDVSVRVSPQEVEYVKAQREELEAVVEGVKSLRVIADRRVSPGGCVVECSSGTFDARIPTQLERLDRRLMQTYEESRTDRDSGPDEIPAGGRQD